jgi:hypothetical protein
MLKKGSLMNRNVALGVVQLKKHKPETKVAVVMAGKNAKCSQLFALREHNLSNRMNQSIHLGRMSNNLAFEAGSTKIVTQPAKHRIILVE